MNAWQFLRQALTPAAPTPAGMKSRKSKQGGEGGLRSYAVLWILIGAILILVDIGLELLEKIWVAGDEEIFHFLTRSFEAAGIASLVFGMFSLFIELPEVRDYFRERMKEIVMERAYLKGLNEEELRKHQIEAMQAHFRNDKIGEQGSFLRFFYACIFQYINEPYRERLTLEIRSLVSGLFAVYRP